MDQNQLLIIEGTDYCRMTQDLLTEVNLEDLIGDKNKRVRIKPNILGPILPEEGATTHLEVVEGILKYLKSCDFTNVAVMEGSWVGDRTSDSISLLGYDSLCDKYEVPFIDMQKEPGVTVDCAGLELSIGKAAVETEFLINVPVLKGHCQTKVTCSMKNLKGLLPNPEKRRFHRMGLHDPIAHLSAGLHQDFILIDSICGDLVSEDGGHPVQQNRLVAALDPVLADSYASRVVGLDPSEIDYITEGQRIGLGSMDIEHAQIRYLQDQEYLANVPATESSAGQTVTIHDAVYRESFPGVGTFAQNNNAYRRALSLAEKAEAVDSCSACYAALLPALERLEEDGLLERLQEKICIGQSFKGCTGKLGVGSCTAKFDHTVKGCPPKEEDMYQFLKNYLIQEVKA